MLLLLIVLGCFLVYVNYMVIQPLKDKTENEMKRAAVQVSDQLNLYISNQNQLSQRILSNKEVFTLLSAGDYSQLTLEGLTRSRRLKDIMFQALGPSLNIEDMMIYDLTGERVASYIGYADSPASLRPFLEESSNLPTWNASGYALYRQGRMPSLCAGDQEPEWSGVRLSGGAARPAVFEQICCGPGGRQGLYYGSGPAAGLQLSGIAGRGEGPRIRSVSL